MSQDWCLKFKVYNMVKVIVIRVILCNAIHLYMICSLPDEMASFFEKFPLHASTKWENSLLKQWQRGICVQAVGAIYEQDKENTEEKYRLTKEAYTGHAKAVLGDTQNGPYSEAPPKRSS